MRMIPLQDFLGLLKEQRVPIEFVSFRCPTCGLVHSAVDLIEVGAGGTFQEVERFLGFSCPHRWKFHGAEQSYDFGFCVQSGSAFNVYTVFEPATPKQAQDHMRRFMSANKPVFKGKVGKE